jgi:plastocyanin
VRAAATGLIALALALAAGTATGASAECTWQKHSKAVVKKVKRHGKVRRVKRMRYWWACDPVAAALLPALPVPTPTPSTGPPTEEAPAGPEHLGVKADDRAEPWSYTLSRPEVPAGELIVELNNMGEDPHDLNLRLQGSEDAPLQVPITPSLQQTSRRFTLPAGTYRLWCDLDEHDERGMNAILVVGAS